MESIKKIKWSTFGYGVLALLMVLFAASIIVVYFAPRSPMIQSWVARLPYPVVVINYRSFISFQEVAENMQSIRRFYENQDFSKIGLRVDFSTEEGQKRLKVREKEVLNKMVEDQAIVLLAKERGIFVSPEVARQGVARKLQEYGSAEKVREDLARLYGWKLADFEEKVVLPSLYEEKLKESFEKEVDPVGGAREKIEKAAEALRGGAAFDTVTKEYSEGQTAAMGGDVGWFTLANLAPELRSPVVLQRVGVPGNVVESSLGFHIVLIEEVKQEKNEQLYHLRQVFTRKATFGDWLSEKMKAMPIWVLGKEYRYDTGTARIEFRDPAWQKFEKELYEKMNSEAPFFF